MSTKFPWGFNWGTSDEPAPRSGHLLFDTRSPISRLRKREIRHPPDAPLRPGTEFDLAFLLVDIFFFSRMLPK